jgi:hypothetical protein
LELVLLFSTLLVVIVAKVLEFYHRAFVSTFLVASKDIGLACLRVAFELVIVIVSSCSAVLKCSFGFHGLFGWNFRFD